MASREIKHLHPDVQVLHNKWYDRCRRDVELLKRGVTVLVTCTYRDEEEQARLYEQGRTKPGAIVTNAKPGQSKHNNKLPDGTPAALAFDFVPLLHGKPMWSAVDDPATPDVDEQWVWHRVGEHGEAVGLKWAGRWTGRLREYPHLEA